MGVEAGEEGRNDGIQILPRFPAGPIAAERGHTTTRRPFLRRRGYYGHPSIPFMMTSGYWLGQNANGKNRSLGIRLIAWFLHLPRTRLDFGGRASTVQLMEEPYAELVIDISRFSKNYN